jgi:hypothetical protein
MARVVGGSDITGKIGPVVFVNFNGKKYARMAPMPRSKASWTEKQKQHRQRFRAINAFWRQFYRTPVKQIWDLAAEAEKMRGVNLFIRTNLAAFSPDGSQIDLEWLHLSAGKLPMVHKLKAERMQGDPEKVEVTWEDNSDIGLASTRDELVMTVAYDGKFTNPIPTGAIRKKKSALIQLPEGIGTIQGIYLSFAYVGKKLYSPDQWFGI